MPEVSTLLQRSQVGVESTPGTPIAANRALTATSIALNAMPTIGTFRPKGYKFNTLTLPGSEWVEGEIEGVLSYSDLIYLLASVIDTPPAATQPDVANMPDAWRWVFEPASTSEDDPVTFTVEEGGAVRAHRASGVLVTEFGFSFTRSDEDGIELSGAVLGRKLEDGVTLTASPTEVTAQPVLPQHFTAYLDDPAADPDAALGTTKLGRVLSLEFNIESRWGPVWVIDRDQDSYVATIETEPEFGLTMLVEADAEGMGLLDVARAGSTRMLRLEAVGPEIPGGDGSIDFGLTMDLATKVSEVGEFSDEDGVYAIEYSLVAVHDPTWGKALTVTVDNALDAL